MRTMLRSTRIHPKAALAYLPSMVVLAMLLEYHDDCSDFEAEQRMRFDLRWKHALGLNLKDEGFDATVFCRFRRKLLERGLERNLFERLVKVCPRGGPHHEGRHPASGQLSHPRGCGSEGHLHPHPRRHQEAAAARSGHATSGKDSAWSEAVAVHRPRRPREARHRLERSGDPRRPSARRSSVTRGRRFR